ncbi:MAG TPA: hypothetical protein VJ549_06605, partial [Geothrix sp.]|nr:hypothetical protein [Geothrix sp.]
PFWNGEVGLNGDICQLAAHVFKRTKRIHVGSAVMNIVCNGGPLAHAEKIATFATLHGLDHDEHRQLHVGFSAGRFDFMNRVTGIDGRNAWEESAWPLVKNKVFWEASEIFLRLLRGETLSSDAVPEYSLRRADCRNEAEWEKIRDLAGSDYDAKAEAIPIPRRWRFEPTRIVPAHWRRELVVPVLGSHDAPLQEYVNRFRPVQIFNLSITRPEIIEDTHRRMAAAYHHDGGPWRRDYMPRTVFVFINAQGHLSPEQQRHHAQEEAQAALGAYWRALDGTLDPTKVVNAADNALIGNPEDIAQQILERFHPEDRLMLWFDFFNHDNARVIANMEAFMREVAPKVEAALSEGRA